MAHQEFHPFLKSYLKTGAALFVLLGATVGASFLPLGGFALPVAAAIAFVKVYIVMWVFMHVRKESKLVWVFSAGAFLWLAVLFVLTMADYVTRAEIPKDEWKTDSHAAEKALQ
ncbi:MAG: cytochrome C oxidase subunit IV family protein [Sumerlaeia bacterium]